MSIVYSKVVAGFVGRVSTPMFRSSHAPLAPIYQSPRVSKLWLSTATRATGGMSTTQDTKTEGRSWNVASLQKQITKLASRCHKKIGKACQRRDKLDDSKGATESESMIDDQLSGLRNQLQQLNNLQQFLEQVNGKKVVFPEQFEEMATLLQLDDSPGQRSVKKKKTKGPKNMTSFRRPYRRYYTVNDTEIRVGKQAEDNDQLSLSPEHRDGSDWWMHASGCPGSHVVIRSHDPLTNEVMQDAAALAARQSKCTGSVIKVSLTRARDVQKPPGVKAGTVQLTGSIRTVSVDMKQAEARLERLDQTVLVN